MKQEQLARLFFKAMDKVLQGSNLPKGEKIKILHRLLNRLYLDVTGEERVQFTTLFARIAYAGHKYNLSRRLQFFIHEFRKQVRLLAHRPKEAEEEEQVYLLGLKALALSIAGVYGQPVPEHIAAQLPSDHFYRRRPAEVQQFVPLVRVVVVEIDREAEHLIARTEDEADKDILIAYNIAERNENFKDSIRALEQYFELPAVLNLLEVEIGKDGIYRPKAFVLEPDYLIDISAVAESFKDFGAEPLLYLLKKFLPFEYSVPLMIGNIANFFLDELMNHPEASFKDIFPKVFQLNPLAFTIFSDRDLHDIMSLSKKHFAHLKRMVHDGFAEEGIGVKDCFLEPSFYSNRYGLQGRLDVFYLNREDTSKSAIVELKSGKIFKANKWGINQNHYVQTLLYDLLIKSVFDGKLQPTNYILYSGVDDKILRFAPVTKAQQFDAIHIRNLLVSMEKALAKGEYRLFQKLDPEAIKGASGFVERDLMAFAKTYKAMRPIEKSYFNLYSTFIAKEHILAKTGIQGLESINGLASLWLNDFEEKTASFDILSHLKIKDISTQNLATEIVFEKTEKSHPLANFRQGDIIILYPYHTESDSVLNKQIFKGSITQVTEKQVTTRLRAKQFNLQVFEDALYWNLEHDLMDSSFTTMYRGLFALMNQTKSKRDLLLTLRAPSHSDLLQIAPPKGLTEEQAQILQKMISAKDYFLLWGPPGTGKTSVMLRQMVSYILNETDENILLLAYTNRAVDEICAAVESIDKFAREEYLRIGSRTSTNPAYVDRLLSSKMESIKSRKALKELLSSHRIFIATVASMSSKIELLKFKQFTRVIIDEASQILEPTIVGLLPLFERFILIGDHRQLPAVVKQDSHSSKVKDENLQAIGLNNLRNSLFERLYNRCQKENWDWAYGQLTHQGRMHQDIMAFSSRLFYGNALKTLPEGSPKHEEQNKAIEWELPDDAGPIEKMLCSQRVLFLNTPPNDTEDLQKNNPYEAKRIAELILAFQKIYAFNGVSFTKDTLGIITPYRAQIAQIKSVLQEESISDDLLTIDTVERYQGGARDIILLSLCANHSRQLRSLISHSDEGVDRKLNVALTRARKHLIILGNAEVLKADRVYRELMDYARIRKEI